MIQSSIYHQGLEPGLGGMDFVTAHFCKIAQVRKLTWSLGIVEG